MTDGDIGNGRALFAAVVPAVPSSASSDSPCARAPTPRAASSPRSLLSRAAPPTLLSCPAVAVAESEAAHHQHPVAGAVVGHTGQRMDARDGYNMTLCYSHGAADGHVALAAPRRGGRGQSEAEAAAEAASAGASMVPPDAQGTVRQVRAAVVAGLPPQAGEGASTSAALRTETMGLQSEAGAAAEAATCSRHPAARGARRICRQRARRTQASARGAPTRSAVALAEPTAHAPVRPSSGGGWVAHIHAHAYI